MNLKPVRLMPAFKDYLWGGTRLKTEFNKKTPFEKTAESWELSVHKDGESVISGGEYDGYTLREYIDKNGKEILGKNAQKFEFFPILIKFIDAADNLSIQVHPSDEYALKNEGEYGKTEMWYVIGCDDGAFLYYGFKKEITKEEFRKRIEENTLTEVLNKVFVKPGDVFFIEAGTVHAIGKGTMICEIQQNSNKTYRVYDYDRRDKNGNPRELHIEKAIDVANLKPPEIMKTHRDGILAKCRYFTVEKLVCRKSADIVVDESCFKSLIVISGSGTLSANGEEMSLEKGDSIFVPAGCGNVKILGDCEIIVSYV